MHKISECPNCKSKNISLLGSDLKHPECYLLFLADKENKTVDQTVGIPLHAYRCLDCNYISFFHAMPEELENNN